MVRQCQDVDFDYDYDYDYDYDCDQLTDLALHNVLLGKFGHRYPRALTAAPFLQVQLAAHYFGDSD